LRQKPVNQKLIFTRYYLAPPTEGPIPSLFDLRDVFPPYRRQGVALRASRPALDYAASELGASRVVIKMLFGNTASGNLAIRLGATYSNEETSDTGGVFDVYKSTLPLIAGEDRILVGQGLVDRRTRDLDFFDSSSPVLTERLQSSSSALSRPFSFSGKRN
jgi:hypothetical protein